MNSNHIIEVPLRLITSDQQNTEYSGIEILASLIEKEGFLIPISVRNNPNKKGEFIVNLGEKHYRAALALGLDTIPVYIEESPKTCIKSLLTKLK